MSDALNEHRRPHPQPMAAPYLEFDIARELEQLHREAGWQSGQNARSVNAIHAVQARTDSSRGLTCPTSSATRDTLVIRNGFVTHCPFDKATVGYGRRSRRGVPVV
jgi:hypothetical protein